MPTPTTTIEKPQCRGRGLGVGWIGKYRPKPCRVSKEEVLKLPRSFADARTHILLHSQTSVENLSDRIARDILGSEGNEQETREIERAGSVDDQVQNWIDSIENDSALAKGNVPIRNKADKNGARSTDHRSILMSAVHAEEFVPSGYMTQGSHGSDEASQYYDADGFQPFEELTEEEIVLCVLDDVITALLDDPGGFDDAIENLTEHLVNFVTQEKTLKLVIDRMIEKAITEPSFSFITAKLAKHFDDCKAMELENGVTFRKVFFRRCQSIHEECVSLCKNEESCKENEEKICRIVLLFGELLCAMKLKDQVNPLFKNVINDYIDIFLNMPTDVTIIILTSLLKLVGPELDANRPKDVDALFDRFKDFYLDSSRSGHLAESVKNNLWAVYKLHSRDWDREASPLSPAAEFFDPEPPIPPLIRQTSLGRRSSRSSSSSPVNWDEYYDGGDDLDLYRNYMDRYYPGQFCAEDYTVDERGEYWFDKKSGTSEEDSDAFEEFLKVSGQME